MGKTECENCESEIEYSTGPRTPFTEDNPPRICNNCADDEAFRTMAKEEPPEGGWPRNSDIDRL